MSDRNNNILFVLEGDVKEEKILDRLSGLVFDGRDRIIYKYCTHIYRFYSYLSEDEDLDLFTFLKQDDRDNVLDGLTRDDVAEIYLFFDYDGHVGMPLVDGEEAKGDDILARMLEFFDNETENGKLMISYPMVEAIQHYPGDSEKFKVLAAKCKGRNCAFKDECDEVETCKKEPGYKTVANTDSPRLAIIDRIDDGTWMKLTGEHLRKLNFVTEGDYTLPTRTHPQSELFEVQRRDFLSQKCPRVSVISAFPVFIFDYLGAEATGRLLGE